MKKNYGCMLITFLGCKNKKIWLIKLSYSLKSRPSKYTLHSGPDVDQMGQDERVLYSPVLMGRNTGRISRVTGNLVSPHKVWIKWPLSFVFSKTIWDAHFYSPRSEHFILFLRKRSEQVPEGTALWDNVPTTAHLRPWFCSQVLCAVWRMWAIGELQASGKAWGQRWLHTHLSETWRVGLTLHSANLPGRDTPLENFEK